MAANNDRPTKVLDRPGDQELLDATTDVPLGGLAREPMNPRATAGAGEPASRDWRRQEDLTGLWLMIFMFLLGLFGAVVITIGVTL